MVVLKHTKHYMQIPTNEHNKNSMPGPTILLFYL